MLQALLQGFSSASVGLAKICWQTAMEPILYFILKFLDTIVSSMWANPFLHMSHIMFITAMFVPEDLNDFHQSRCVFTAAITICTFWIWYKFHDTVILCFNMCWVIYLTHQLGQVIQETLIDNLGDERINRLYKKYFMKYNVSRRRFRKMLRPGYFVKGGLRGGDAYALPGFPAGNRMTMLLFGEVGVHDENNHTCNGIGAPGVIDMFKPKLLDIITIYKVALVATRCSDYIYWEFSTLAPLLKEDVYLNAAVCGIMNEYSVDKYMTTNLQAGSLFDYKNITGIARYDDPDFIEVLQLLSLKYNAAADYHHIIDDVLRQRRKEQDKTDNVQGPSVTDKGSDTGGSQHNKTV